MRDLATPLELWEVPECINATEKIDSKSQYFDISRWHICDLTMGQPSRYQNRVSMDIEKKGGGVFFAISKILTEEPNMLIWNTL